MELALPDRVLVAGVGLVVAVDHDVPSQGNPWRYGNADLLHLISYIARKKVDKIQ